MGNVDAPTVAAVASSLSAFAAAVSARSSRQAVTRSNAPFVWPALRIGSRDSGVFSFYVRLHNDGPGVAFNVRFTVRTREDEHGYVIPPIRAMRSGEVVPPHPEPQEQPIRDAEDGSREYAVAGPRSLDAPSWVVVRFSDALGRRWEVAAPADPHDALLGPRRLRARRFQVWRRHENW
jgi:hypothetical protein